MKILFSKTGKKWNFGKPKADDLPLEEMAAEFVLDEKLIEETTKNNETIIQIALRNEVLKRLTELGKISHSEADQLIRIRDSIKNKEEFYSIAQEIMKADGWGRTIIPPDQKVSLFWYYRFVLLQRGLSDHAKYFKKTAKKRNEYCPI